MIGKEDIGKESPPEVMVIRPELVRRFAEAIGIPYDHKVPPTFVTTLRFAKLSESDFPPPGTIHGEQVICYTRPLREGEKITYVRNIKDIYEKNGRSGKMTFVVVETIGSDVFGDQIFSSESTLIIPEGK
ncbi:MAG: MaoC family dehydratase [Desulfitobacterium sp.]|nr:MaoC family dehydratase [Desulfitobacterium sp.]